MSRYGFPLDGRGEPSGDVPSGPDDELRRLALAVEAAGLGTFRVELEGRTVHCSPELSQMLGFPGVSATTLEAALLRVHRDDQARVTAQFLASLDPAGDGRLRIELRYVRPGGVIRWMTWNGRAEFRETEGQRVAFRILGACADITDRKEAEFALREGEARFRSLLALSSDWYWEQDDQFRFTEFSTPVERLTSTSVSSLIGTLRWELPTKDVSEETWRAHRALLERHEPFRDFELQRINEVGETIWISINGDPIFDAAGRFRGYRGTGHNITDRKLAEARLRESEARFRFLADSAPVLIWVSGQAGEEFFNKSYQEFVGRTEVELKGLGWATFLHPEDRDAYLEAFAACRARQAQFEVQFRFLRCDGEYRWMKSIGLPRFASDGRCLGYVGSALDISDIKHHEERIVHLARELDHRVKNILSRFEAVVERTADAPLATEEFVAALKHRIDSMARAHSLLSRTNWAGAPLESLIIGQLEAYATRRNLHVSGESLVLAPDATQSLSMVINELATNAAKYGALSTATGRVSVTWRVDQSVVGGATLTITWQERGGPPVSTLERRGYGTSVIRELLVHELGGVVDLALEPAGVSCTIVLPVSGVIAGR